MCVSMRSRAKWSVYIVIFTMFSLSFRLSVSSLTFFLFLKRDPRAEARPSQSVWKLWPIFSPILCESVFIF